MPFVWISWDRWRVSSWWLLGFSLKFVTITFARTQNENDGPLLVNSFNIFFIWALLHIILNMSNKLTIIQRIMNDFEKNAWREKFIIWNFSFFLDSCHKLWRQPTKVNIWHIFPLRLQFSSCWFDIVMRIYFFSSWISYLSSCTVHLSVCD